MRYYVTLGGRTYDIGVEGDHITIDGERIDADLVHVAGTPVHRLSLHGASHRIVAERGEARGQWRLHVDGYRVTADVVDERTSAIRAMTAARSVQHGPRPVRAPMPGMIVRVEVEAGERVSAGQGVVVMEAMKMENELKADGDGIVSRIAVHAGTAVEKGMVLIEFEQDGSAHG